MEHKFFDQNKDVMGAKDLFGSDEEAKKGKDGEEGTEMKAIKGDDDEVEELDKDDKSKGDDDQAAAAPPTPDVIMKDNAPSGRDPEVAGHVRTSTGAPLNEVDGKEEVVAVIP